MSVMAVSSVFHDDIPVECGTDIILGIGITGAMLVLNSLLLALTLFGAYWVAITQKEPQPSQECSVYV